MTTENVADIQLVTLRLKLRPYRPSDFGIMHHLVSHDELFSRRVSEHHGEQESWSRLLRQIGSWTALGYGFFAVEERTTGRFVGEAGFTLFRRNLGFDDAPEATWTMLPEAQGLGYATEAAAAAQVWLERRFAFPRTLCMIDPANGPSLSVAAKLGYRECGRAEYRKRPVTFFERTRPLERGLWTG